MRWLLLLSLVSAAMAQPRSPEFFGHVGAMRLAGDEGPLGTALSYGGTAMIPFASHWAVDVDVTTAVRKTDEIGFPNLFRERRTLFSPAVVYRRGTEKAYGFVGGGFGLQNEQTRVQSPSQTFESSDTGATFHGRFGLVAAVTPRLLVRADFLMVFRYVLPSYLFRVGVGYRF